MRRGIGIGLRPGGSAHSGDGTDRQCLIYRQLPTGLRTHPTSDAKVQPRNSMWLGWPNDGFRSDSSWEFVPSVETETTSNNPELPVPK